jgi:ATP-binding cassette subfamily F protein 3
VALNEFEGTVMLVSHDRALLRAVCDEFWLVSRGGIAPFDGDLDDYQRYLLDVAKQAREAQKQAGKEVPPAVVEQPAAPAAAPASRTPEQRKLDAQKRQQKAEQLRPLRKELEQNEKRMAALNAEKQALEDQLSQPATPDRLADSGRRLKLIGEEIEVLEMRWLELSEQLESASSDSP